MEIHKVNNLTNNEKDCNSIINSYLKMKIIFDKANLEISKSEYLKKIHQNHKSKKNL